MALPLSVGSCAIVGDAMAARLQRRRPGHPDRCNGRATGPAEGVEVFGTTGAVRVDLHFPFYRRAATVHAYTDGAVVVPTLTDGDVYERQVEAFARTIRTGGHPDPDVRDGLAAVRLIEATVAAVETGSEVEP
jgi:predicted dehydrogenase